MWVIWVFSKSFGTTLEGLLIVFYVLRDLGKAPSRLPELTFCSDFGDLSDLGSYQGCIFFRGVTKQSLRQGVRRVHCDGK